jgi:glucose-6-phosphate dehydrogenase assembly protein OpcA
VSTEPLLPNGVEVPFGQIDEALNTIGDERCRRGALPALTATVVVIGPPARLPEAATALEEVAGTIGIRPVLISDGDRAEPTVFVSEHAVALEGLRASFVNNAVAALRLSSLPTLVWWRGGAPEALEGLSELCDRLVLDAEDPLRPWDRAAGLMERTAVSDLRWTQLTRWRALMAHFFDIPEVRAAASGFSRLQIEETDPHAARLYAAWLIGSLRLDSRVALDLRHVPGGPALRSIRFGDGTQELMLRLASNGTCVETRARVERHATATRVVSLGKQDLATLIAEELRVRSRDLAFEEALRLSRGLS